MLKLSTNKLALICVLSWSFIPIVAKVSSSNISNLEFLFSVIYYLSLLWQLPFLYIKLILKKS